MRKFFFILMGCVFLQMEAQQTAVYTDPLLSYKQGLELFTEKNYLSARQKFEELNRLSLYNASNQPALSKQNLDFYVAVCAVETNANDAEKLLLEYYKKYHETDLRKQVYFYLGKYYFQNNKYTEAAEWYAKVQPFDLDQDQRTTYKFNLGYCYFIKKKFDEAKPYFRDIKDIKEKYYYPANYYYAFICFYKKEYNDALKSFLNIQDSKLYASVIPYYVSQIYYLKKDYTQTISYIKNNIDKSDVLYKDEMGHLLGEAYFQKSDYEHALPLLEKFVTKNEKVRKEDIYELAYSYYQLKEYNKAIDYFVQLNLLNEKIGQNATYSLADCYLKTNQKDKAKTAFQSAAAMDFDQSIKHISTFQFGKLSFESGNSNDAIQSLENYLKADENGIYADEANELLAAALVQTKDYERAYKIIEGLKNWSPLLKETYQKVTYFRATEKFNDKKMQEAIALCDKSLKYTPNQDFAALTQLLKAEALFIEKKYDEALPNYQRFTQVATESFERKNNLSAERGNYGMGYCYFKKKNYSAALIHFKKATQGWANTADVTAKQNMLSDAMLRLGDCAFVSKEYAEAFTAYKKVYNEQKQGSDYACFQMGLVQGLQSKNSEKINTLRDLIRTYEQSEYAPLSYFEIGETFMEDDMDQQAMSEFQHLISIYPNHYLVPKSNLKVALAQYNMGKKEEALNTYKKVIQTYPSTKEAKEALLGIRDLSVELGRPEDYLEYASTSQSEKDSLTFEAAQTAFMNDDCPKAINLFTTYLSKFPKGFFVNEALNSRAECNLKQKKYAEVLADYDALLQNKFNKNAEKILLNASGIAYYETKETQRANQYYKDLYKVSSNSSNTYTAMLGVMKTAQILNKNEEVLEFADKLLNHAGTKEADANEAYYLKGKAALSLGKQDVALDAFRTLSNRVVSEKAAEAKYYVAKILYERKDYKASNDSCLKLKNKFASYEFWVVKTYILMADNYVALGNSFQAKATLESIVDNYDGDQTLLDEAKQKLEIIKNEELKKSKIQELVPSDTLIMEKDFNK